MTDARKVQASNVCIGTYDCTSHTDSCGTGCPAGKFVTVGTNGLCP